MFARLKTQALSWWHSVPLANEPDSTVRPQLWHALVDSSWTPYRPSPSSSPNPRSEFTLVTWNVDSSGPDPSARITALIDHIRLTVPRVDVIFLQEVGLSALSTLLSHPWILAEGFLVSDVDGTNWRGRSSWGTVTLVRRQGIGAFTGGAFRLDFPSRFDRDALFFDLHLPSSSSSPQTSRIVRLINVHLDSLPVNPSLRPRQLAICASHLLASGGHGLVAGDFNPVLPEDSLLCRRNGLVDAWERLRPGEDGVTHGEGREEELPYPPTRLDKVATMGIEPTGIDIIKAGTLDDGTAWTDHHGLSCRLTV